MPRQNRELSASQKVRLCAGAFLLAASGCGAAAVIIIDWFHINRGGRYHWYGLFYQTDSTVLDAPDAFGQIGFDDLTNICARSGVAMGHRNDVTQGTAVTGLILAFLASMVSVIDFDRMVYVQLLLALLASFFQIFALSWSAYIFESWYWCGMTACDYDLAVEKLLSAAHVPCFQTRGRGWNVQVGASVCAFIGLVLVLVAWVVRKPKHPKGTTDPKVEKAKNEPTARANQGASEMTVVPVAAAQQAPAQQVGTQSRAAHEPTLPPRGPMSKPKLPRDSPAPAAPAHPVAETQQTGGAKNALPPGDWVLDPQSGLYWSEQEKLFLHLDTAMFFDPSTGMWCNSETGEWFHPEENQ